MKNYFFTLLFCFTFFNLLLAQKNISKDIQELINKYEESNENKVKLYLDSALIIAQSKKDTLALALINRKYGDFFGKNLNKKKAIEHFKISGLFYNVLDDSLKMGSCNYLIAIAHYRMSNLDSSKIYYAEALKLYSQVDYEAGIGGCLNGFGLINSKLGKYEEAIKNYLEAVDYLSKPEHKAEMLVNIALLNKEIGNKDKELSYLQQALKIFQNEGLTKFEGICYNNIGEHYFGEKKYDLAFENLKKSTSIHRTNKDTISLGLALNNLAATYYATNDYVKAIPILNRLINISRNKPEMNNNIAYSKQHLGLIKIHNEECNQGVLLIEESVNLFDKVNLNRKKDALLDLAKAYEKCGNLSLSLPTYKKYISINDSLSSHQKHRNVEELITKYETEKKEAENQLLKKEKELQSATIQQQRFTLFGTVGGIGLLALISLLLYRQSAERKRTNTILGKQKEQIETLHKELAHRVKNNLFFISTLMKMQGKRLENKEAKEAVKEGEARLEAMSLLHRKLHLGENETDVNIGEYLKELCANLQNTFPHAGNQPQIAVTTDEIMVEGEPAVRIGLIVNELVTNSFKYAFKNQENPLIHVTVKKTSNVEYQLAYQDNGAGISSNFDISSSKSMGLKLINTLTKQMDGTIEFFNQNGARFEFKFSQKRITA